jgi:transglutaminase-like putative cysteine protease
MGALIIMPTLTRAAPPTGASSLWTSTDPTITKARQLIEKGELTKAEAVLELADDLRAPDRDEALDVIHRIRQDYGLSSGQLFQTLQPQIKGLQAGELDAWRETGQLQFRTIDGQIAYFRREPSNLFRFCPDAIARRIRKPAAPSNFVLTDHLAKVIEEAERTGETQVVPIRHRIRYVLTVPGNTAGAKNGSIVRAWLPFPQEYRQQSDVKLISASPANPLIAENGAAHRTLFFEHRIVDPSQTATFEAVYEYTSHAYYPKLDDAKVQKLPDDFPHEYLEERLPHIQFSPLVKRTAAQIVGDETNPLAKARKIFHWVDKNIRYNAEEEYCIIPSFSEHGLSRRRGDCGIQGTTFITLCRAAGVPARWQSGWETKPVDWNMHDWSEIYVAPWGWLPVDASYGTKKSDNPAVRDFYFGHQDSYRMIVNLDYGHPLTPPKKSLRSEPADFQRGEVELDGKNLYFDQWDYDFSFTQSER